MMHINNVDYAYYSDQPLLTDLNMKFEPGSIYGLLGKNGAGKTTLMKLLSGVCFPKKGQILIDGIDSKGRNPKYLSKLYLIPEEFDFDSIRIKTFVKIYAPFYKDFDISQFHSYLDEFKISQDEKPTSMSLGEKKKFLLSFALACNTEILMMDEPTNGLDINSKVIFRKIMASLANENRIFIISTHQIRDIEGIIDNICILDEGKMKLSVSINDIINKFEFTDSEHVTESDILYSENRFNRDIKICRNNGNVFTKIDLELLFNAVIQPESKIIDLLINENAES